MVPLPSPSSASFLEAAVSAPASAAPTSSDAGDTRSTQGTVRDAADASETMHTEERQVRVSSDTMHPSHTYPVS